MSNGTPTPLVPLLAPVPQQAMSLSAALRQAAIDMPPMVDGFTVSASVTAEGAAFVARVQMRNVQGVLVWEQPYDGRGRRITAGVGVTF